MSGNQNIFLIGPMGSGKTAVGKQLARLLHLGFYDSDVEIERRTGVDIPYIFEKEGETGFREREREAIELLTQLKNVVIATGGGAILLPQNRSCLADRGQVVYLKTGIDQQLERTRHGQNGPLIETPFERAGLVYVYQAMQSFGPAPPPEEPAGRTVTILQNGTARSKLPPIR